MSINDLLNADGSAEILAIVLVGAFILALISGMRQAKNNKKDK